MKQVRRYKFIFFLFILALALLLINSLIFYFRIDITKGRFFSLSEVSLELFKKIPETVYITYYRSDRLKTVSSVPGQIEDMLKEYSARSRRIVRVSFIDPDKQELHQETEKYGIFPRQIELFENNERATAWVYSGILIEYRDRSESLPFVFSPDDLEYNLTRSILKLVENREKTIGIIIGDKNRTLDQDYSTAAESFGTDWKLMEIPRGSSIGRDISALIVLGNRDLSLQDVLTINEYIRSGGSALICTEGVYVDIQEGLEAEVLEDNPLLDLLSIYGIEIEKVLIQDPSSKDFRVPHQVFGQIAWQVIGPYPQWIKILPESINKEHPVSSGFSGLDLLWASPISLIAKEGIDSTILIRSSEQSWITKDPPDTDPYSRPSSQTGATQSFITGVLLEITGEGGKDIGTYDNSALLHANTGSRLVIISDTDFLSDLTQYSNSPGNYAFAGNLVSWLTREEVLLDLKNRNLGYPGLSRIKDPDQRKGVYSLIQIVNLVIIPFIIILFGIVRFFRRKRA